LNPKMKSKYVLAPPHLSSPLLSSHLLSTLLLFSPLLAALSSPADRAGASIPS
jgi:hypothetical protein